MSLFRVSHCHGRSSGTATLFSYGWPDDQITDAASRDTDQLVQTVNNKFNAGWQTGAAIAVADIATLSGSKELDGFTHEMFSRAEQAWQLEYQSVVGQRVLNSMSADSFEEAPLYVLGAGGLAMEAVPLLGAGKKFGTVIDKTSDAFDGFVDAVRVIKRQERAADKADSLKTALSSFSSRHFGHVDDGEILYTGLRESEDLLRMPWEKTKDVLEDVGFGFGRYDGNGYGAVNSAGVVREKTPLRYQIAGLSPSDTRLVESVETFRTHGVSHSEALNFIHNAPEGQRLFDVTLKAAGPEADLDVVLRRAAGYVETGVKVPALREIGSPLIKIVPTGGNLSGYSPFFTTQSQLDFARRSGRPLSDVFGLPAISDASRYGVFEITPSNTVPVFESVVAPTSELGGRLTTKGGGLQYVVPDRAEFSHPRFIEVIDDNF